MTSASRRERVERVWHERPIEPEFVGRVPYARALDDDRAARERVLRGESREALRLYEHDWVLTTGRRRVEDLPAPSFWKTKGIPIVRTERGGLATLHGPGQLVAAMILNLPERGLGVKRAVYAIERGLIRWLAGEGIEAARRDGAPGVWVGTDKIASLGLHVRHGVTLHGFALNLSVETEPFSWFVPCGVREAGVTSVLQLAGRAPSPRECSSKVGNEVLWSLLESALDGSGDSQ